jgi:hypothetical protein
VRAESLAYANREFRVLALDLVPEPTVLEALSREALLKRAPKPPRIDHQGINDMFYGKASVVYYDFGGKWLGLSGTDEVS